MLKKITPFILLTIAAVLHAAYILFTDETGWGIFFVLALLISAIAAFLIDFGLQKFLKSYKQIFLAELLTVMLIVAVYAYQFRTKTLVIPSDFDQSYVTIIYTVDDAEDLSINPFTLQKEIEIPANGIFLSASDFNEDLPQTEIKTTDDIYLNSDESDKGFIIMANSQFESKGREYKFRTWKIESAFCCGYSSTEVDSFKLSLQKTFEKLTAD